MSDLFSSDAFMPHGHCYLWKPAVLWLQVGTNALIGVAYVAIAATLLLLVRRVEGMPFRSIYLAFGAFIVACGVTHFSDVWVIWDPRYWVDSGIRAVTAVASVATALMLPPLVPKAAALVRSAQAAQRRGIRFETMFHELEHVHERTLELEQAKTQFFANVSHELRTPITLILGPVQQLLASDRLDAGQRDALDVVQRNALTLLKHVNDLLDVAQLESGDVPVRYVQVDVARRLRELAMQFEGLAGSRGMTLRVEAPEQVVAELDPEKFDRVALNLLGNAFKFTPDGGLVHCRLEATMAGPDDERIVFEVADSGPGIPAAARERVFERFQQVDGTASRPFGGTGLGLAIVREFVELHGGVVRVEDAQQGGALLRAELPRHAPPGVAVAAEAAPADPRVAATQTQGAVLTEAREPVADEPLDPEDERPLVLVVEDQPDMNRFVREALAPHGRTAAARDGHEGLEKARKLRPDLIVCDVMMPGLSGEALVDALHREEGLADVPVIVLTAKADADLPARLLSAGARDFLSKPFSVAELRARAVNLLVMRRARVVLEREVARQSGTLEELAEQLAAQKRHLEVSLDAVRVARDQAERTSELKTSLLRLVSHELRAPLAVITLQVELFELDPALALDAPRRQLVRRIADAARRLQATIDGMILQARIETGRLEIHPSRFDATTLVAEVVQELRPEAERAGLALRVVGTPVACPLDSDRRLVRLVLANLVGNAVKFTEAGSVEVDVVQQSSGLRIRVRDTGPGIAPEDHTRIFEPFQQLGQTRRKHAAGVGLGLALVRDVVTALGGRIELESAPGRGSTFTVVLPCAAEPEERG